MSHQIVSSEDERLILVDQDDCAIGELSKALCHDGQGKLHRAFSIFLFDEDHRLLVQQRAGSKRLWPMYWANSCCSHPRVGETLNQATERRLYEELGVVSELAFAYRFEYHATFGSQGSEHEMCSVFLGRVRPEDVTINTSEIHDVRWLELDDVDRWVAQEATHPQVSPWFVLEWQLFRGEHAQTLQTFIQAD